MKIIQVPINELKAAEYNPRKAGEKEIEGLRASIKEFGLVDPIIVNSAENRKNIIIGGHFRIRVAKDIGIKEVPVVYVNIPDIKKEQELNLRLNKNLGEFNLDLLANFDEELLKDIGWESEELDKIFNLDATEDDFDAEAEYEKIVEPKVKYGEIYQLGNHRLGCLDATKENDVSLLMGGEKADMVFTDPPYGIDIVNSGNVGITAKTKFGKVGTKGLVKAGSYSKVIGDNKPFDPTFLLTLADKIILWGANNYASKLSDNSHWIIWDKKAEKGADHNNFSDCELAWTNIKKKSVRIYRYLWSGLLREGNRKEELNKRVHPTQKPVGLLKEIIKDYSKRNDIVVDLFGGSGSTLIACEQLNRKCRMMEIDERYCQVIIERWEKYTNNKAKKL